MTGGSSGSPANDCIRKRLPSRKRRRNWAPDSGMNSEHFGNDVRRNCLLRSRRIVAPTNSGAPHGHAPRRSRSPRCAIRASAAEAQSDLHRGRDSLACARHRRERRDLSPRRHHPAAQPRRRESAGAGRGPPRRAAGVRHVRRRQRESDRAAVGTDSREPERVLDAVRVGRHRVRRRARCGIATGARPVGQRRLLRHPRRRSREWTPARTWRRSRWMRRGGRDQPRLLAVVVRRPRERDRECDHGARSAGHRHRRGAGIVHGPRSRRDIRHRAAALLHRGLGRAHAATRPLVADDHGPAEAGVDRHARERAPARVEPRRSRRDHSAGLRPFARRRVPPPAVRRRFRGARRQPTARRAPSAADAAARAHQPRPPDDMRQSRHAHARACQCPRTGSCCSRGNRRVARPPRVADARSRACSSPLPAPCWPFRSRSCRRAR